MPGLDFSEIESDSATLARRRAIAKIRTTYSSGSRQAHGLAQEQKILEGTLPLAQYLSRWSRLPSSRGLQLGCRTVISGSFGVAGVVAVIP